MNNAVGRITRVSASRFDSGIRFLCRVSGVLLFVMVILISASTLSRFFFSAPISGTLEFSEEFFAFAVFFAITYVQLQKGNIRVNFLTMRLPRKLCHILDVFTHLSCAALFSILTWQTGIEAWGSWTVRQAALGAVLIPIYPTKFAISFGCALLTVQFLRDTFNILKGKTAK